MKKKNENKGFTLVELIVVLVILAILAAILVPALLGYIDRARNQQIVLNAKSYMTATQAELSSMYGSSIPVTQAEITKLQTRIQNTADVADCDVFLFATKTETTGANATKDHGNYTLSWAYYEQDGKAVYFNGASWIECDDATTAWSGKSSDTAGTTQFEVKK